MILTNLASDNTSICMEMRPLSDDNDDDDNNKKSRPLSSGRCNDKG